MSIDTLSQKILDSNSFRQRFKELEQFASQNRIFNELPDISEELVERLLLQSSVLAFSEKIEHKRIVQKINAILYEFYPNKPLVNYAIQVIFSRLGNFPVASRQSLLFKGKNVLDLISSNQSETVVDLDLAAGLLQEEESSRFVINDKEYHFNIYQTGILNALQAKRLISFSAPTSFGKSFIVRHYIARRYATHTLGRSIIIVPTKSLIDEFFESFVDLKRKLELNISIYTHARSVEGTENRSVFILTQERLSFLINKYPKFVQNFELVYCDEAHNIARGYRGFVLRQVLSELIRLCESKESSSERTQYIFSSPIIKNPEYYHQKLFNNIAQDEAYHSEIQYSPVEKNIHLIAKDTDSYDYYLLHEAMGDETFEGRLTKIGESKKFPDMLSGDNISEMHRDVHIVLNSNLSGGTILYTTSPLKAHQYGIFLSQNLPEKNEEFMNEIQDLNRYIHDHYDDSFGLIELLKKGVGLHYGPMPVGLRRAIVRLFEKGVIDFIVCTPTLLEGVNLPAKNIFLFSDKYGGAGGKEKHNPLSFGNLIGRAGRITFGLSGNVYCIEKTINNYQKLLENGEADIKDPEEEVVKNNTRKNYLLKAFSGDEGDKFNYIKSHNRDDIEYLIFELLTKDNSEQLLLGINDDDELKENVIREIAKEKAELNISGDLISMNPGIDPRLQNKLYLRLNQFEISRLISYFSIVSNPLAITGLQLSQILSLTGESLKWPVRREVALASRLTQWLHEFPIGEFIRQSIRHLDSSNNMKAYFERVQRAIYVIRELESQCAFRAPKYFKCFFDIALYVASEKGIGNLEIYSERTEAFLFSLESGISSFIGRYLFEKGVSRPVAIKVNSLVYDLVTIPIDDKFFRRQDVIERLKLGLSSIAFSEFSNHL